MNPYICKNCKEQVKGSLVCKNCNTLVDLGIKIDCVCEVCNNSFMDYKGTPFCSDLCHISWCTGFAIRIFPEYA